MKVKLLKKIRKQYSIVYYPDGFLYNGYLYHNNQFVVKYIYNIRPTWHLDSFNSKQEAINFILNSIRNKYKKYSRKYKKPNYRGVKVWHTN